MLNRLKSVWRPENFHLHHMLERGDPCLEVQGDPNID
jgi:hypothetical protein